MLHGAESSSVLQNTFSIFSYSVASPKSDYEAWRLALTDMHQDVKALHHVRITLCFLPQASKHNSDCILDTFGYQLV